MTISSTTARRGGAVLSAGLLLGAVPAIALAAPAQAQAKPTPTARLNPAPASTVAGGKVRLYAYVSIANAPITYYQQIPGRAATVIARGTTDSTGHDAISGTVNYSATYSVRFAGGPRYNAVAARTKISVGVRMALRTGGAYKRAYGYNYYRSYKKGFATTGVAPSKAGRYVRFRLQKKVNGSWTALDTMAFKLTSSSNKTVTFRGVAGARYRLRAEYPSDSVNRGNVTGWSYAYFTR